MDVASLRDFVMRVRKDQIALEKRLAAVEAGQKECLAVLTQLVQALPQLAGASVMQPSPPQTYTPWDGKEPIRVVFLSEKPSAWSCQHSIWQAMRDDPRFEPLIVNQRCLMHNAPVDAAAYFTARGIPFIEQDDCDLGVIKPHVVITTTPYEEAKPPKFRTGAVAKGGARVVYLTYGMEVGGGETNAHWQYRQPAPQTAWRVIARSEAHAEHFARMAQRKKPGIVALGSPKADSIVLARPAPPAHWAEKAQGRPCVLWNAHFAVPVSGQEQYVWSSWHRLGDGLVNFMHEYGDVILLLRLHPQFFHYRRLHGISTEQEDKRLREKLRACPNIIVDEEGDYLPAFSFSDAMISDSSSLLLEYAVLGKPVCRLVTPESTPLQDWLDILLRYYPQAGDVASVRRFLEQTAARQDPYKMERLAALPAVVGPVDGLAGRRIADHIASALGQEPRW